jgi:hypothetical protein
MPNAARREDLASLADYPVLLARVRETFVIGQQKAEELKVQTHWAAGRLIHEHLRHHQDEAGYGKQLMLKLARGLGVGDELLYRMLRFYEAFPISSARRKLSWTHYRTLARLPDKKKRLQIESQATRENWDSRKLEKHISFLTTGAPRTQPMANHRRAASSYLNPNAASPASTAAWLMATALPWTWASRRFKRLWRRAGALRRKGFRTLPLFNSLAECPQPRLRDEVGCHCASGVLLPR